MEDETKTAEQLAICFLRPDLSADTVADKRDMRDLGERLGYTVGEIVEIEPRREGPWATVGSAIARTGAAAVIVPDLEHIDGIDRHIRDQAKLITAEGERILERTGLRDAFNAAAAGISATSPQQHGDPWIYAPEPSAPLVHKRP